MGNEVAKVEQEVVYQVEGREVRLTASAVRDYLVRGKGGPFTTAQEIAFFIGLCRARQMDPWAGDCYIMRYGDRDPAAIVTSIDFVRSRARTSEDCQGWTCGVILEGKDGETRDTAGLVTSGCKLIGGWAEAKPKGWEKPMRVEVNLAGYIKKTSDGKITKFWTEENQPTMISKVAEMQLLRRIWPAAAGKMYLAEEVGGPSLGEGMDVEMAPPSEGGVWEEKDQDEAPLDKLKRMAADSGITDTNSIVRCLEETAEGRGERLEDVAARAAGNSGNFFVYFDKYLDRQKKAKNVVRRQTKPKAEPVKDADPVQNIMEQSPLLDQVTATEPSSQAPQEDTRPDNTGIVCPNNDGDVMMLGYCRTNCPSAEHDCKAHLPGSGMEGSK